MWSNVTLLFFSFVAQFLLANAFFYNNDRSFLEDILNPTRITKRLIKPTLARPSLFHMIKFPNDECINLSNQIGTCYTALQCKAFSGHGTATCAKGYGTCCIMSRSCHNHTSQKVVYFHNPNYPSMDSGQNFCDLSVEVRDPDVCQLRVDFLEFDLDQPVDRNCIGDRMRISASGTNPNSLPILCGKNRNQHLYIHLSPTDKEKSISFLFETNQNGKYRWHLRITQIDCSQGSSIYGLSDEIINRQRRSTNSEQELIIRKKRFLMLGESAGLRISLPAPPGCLQYFSSSSSTIESFNFGHYLNNLDYAICIAHHSNVCKVSFLAKPNEFGIDPSDLLIRQVDQNIVGASGDLQCANDYLMIPGGSADGDFPTKDRYCGGRLQPDKLINNDSLSTFAIHPVVSRINGPIVLRFHSDQQMGSIFRTGFRIKYEQSSTDCTGSSGIDTLPPLAMAPLVALSNTPLIALNFSDQSRKFTAKRTSV